VAKLERRRNARRQCRQERVEQRQVLLEIRRQLEQQRPELVAKGAGDLAETGHEIADVLQPIVVGDPAWRFQVNL
jgi:hypothetical protein